MLKRGFILLVAFSILLCSCNDSSIADSKSEHYEDSIMLIIDDEKILRSELERTKKSYAETSLSDAELLEGIILEAIVLGTAKDYKVSVTDKEVNEKFDSLINLDGGGLFYNKALETYGTDKKIKEAYYYSILYDKVKEKIYETYQNNYSANKDILAQRVNDYVSKYNLEEDKKENFSQDVWNTYDELMQIELFDLYFKVWQYRELDTTKIEYVDVDASSLFQKYNYELNENSLSYKGAVYGLEEWTYKKFQEVFGNILYLSNLDQAKYKNIKINGILEPEKDVKAIYIRLEDDSSKPIIITVVASPYISLNYENQNCILIKDTDGTKNKLVFINIDCGIHYAISSEMEYDELEKMLYEFIPYKVDNRRICSANEGLPPMVKRQRYYESLNAAA